MCMAGDANSNYSLRSSRYTAVARLAGAMVERERNAFNCVVERAKAFLTFHAIASSTDARWALSSALGFLVRHRR